MVRVEESSGKKCQILLCWAIVDTCSFMSVKEKKYKIIKCPFCI